MTDILMFVREAIKPFAFPNAAIEPTSDLKEDLGLDSLDVVEIQMAIEEGLEIDIDDNAIGQAVTVQHVVEATQAAAARRPS